MVNFNCRVAKLADAPSGLEGGGMGQLFTYEGSNPSPTAWKIFVKKWVILENNYDL